MSFKGFSIFCSGSHFVQRSGTILAILVKELQGNICVKLFWNWSSSLGGDVLWMNCWRHTTDDGRLTTDAGHRVITIAHLEHLVLRWAKKTMYLIQKAISKTLSYIIQSSGWTIRKFCTDIESSIALKSLIHICFLSKHVFLASTQYCRYVIMM